MIRAFANAILSLIVLAGLPREADAANNCSVPYIRTLDDQTVNGTMTVKTGTSCRINLRNSSGPMHSVSVVAKPSHGAVRIGGNGVIYQPRKGYVGSDTFTYARTGLNTSNTPVKRTISIAVDVTP